MTPHEILEEPVWKRETLRPRGALPGQRRPGHPADLADLWRREATTLRHRGGQAQADCLESCADDLEQAILATDNTALTLTEAATESGYSPDHLGRQLRLGKLPNAGTKGRPRIRRADLPRRIAPTAFQPYDPDADARTLLRLREDE
jgi:hypothetical protein